MSEIAKAETGIIEEIKSVLMPVGAAKVREVDSLPGSWSYDLLKMLLQKAPGIYVAFINGKGTGNNTDAVAAAKFEIYAVSKLATEKARRHGTNNEIGCYDMIEVCIAVLNGCHIEGIGTLHFDAIDNLFGEAMYDLGGTVYSASFTIDKMVFPDEIDEEGLAQFKIYHAEHSLAPGEDEPDAIDEINLEQ